MDGQVSVLVIEDNPGDARIIQIELRSASRQVDTEIAETLAAGLALAEERGFDVCLLDLSLPDANGAAGLRAIRAAHPELPVVIMTGLDDDDRALEILREGAQDYLVKGQVEGRMLLRAIRYAMERQRLESALRESQAIAERANRAKSTFLANMSHELRTPLNAILGFSQIMEAGLLGPLGHPNYTEYAGDIRSSGEYLLDLINELLDLAKVEAGKMVLTVEPADLVGVVQEVVHLLSSRAESAGIAVRVAVPPGELVQGIDRRAIKQCLLNLLGNALKFCPAGRSIWVTLEDVGDGARLSVTDTGMGIAADQLSRLMHPFEQAGTALMTPERGTGLGLALTKDLVELHGGALLIDSEVGRGTTVTMLLPKAGPPG
jgi:two-component system cell cycle sensor histidine kinase PleC